ncbi:MAG: hypothetical protein K0R03_121 [Moraxellaceae bacterium]|jgi:hypothetical protein|nr:hypothetical protein [Moraxellaceae bacterium]
MEMMEFREEWLEANEIPDDLESADDAEEM